ncbi:MAG: phage protease [Acidimicrobiia bacterium]|nr:phage protease [Acidimicrobiia bacterium]
MIVDEQDGTGVISNLAIFRAGKFRNSKGKPQEVTVDDLDEMVDNFGKLKSELPRVPMRVDHTTSADKVVGHVKKIWRDGKHLMADVALTEPDAVAKYKRGTYHNRSAEIGPYQTNDERRFDRVLRGVAFVDLPAVEGLFTLATDNTGESTVTDEEMTARIAELEEQLGSAQARISELEASQTPAGVFRLAGEETDDFAAVQQYVLDLEAKNAELNEFQASTVAAERESFVKALATDNKILQPQVEHFCQLVETMSAEQFDTFRAGWDGASAASVFSTEGQETGEPAATPATQEEEISEYEIAKEQLAAFRMTGLMTEDDIKNTDAWRIVNSQEG